MIDLRSEYSAMQIIERGDIDDEEAIGINESQEAGMYTCNGLMMQTKKHLTEIKGLSEAKADKICQVAEKLVLPINMRGGNGKVAYSDTEGTFRPDHIVPIAERFGMDAGAVLDNVIYARAYTYEHQYNLLLGLASKMAEEPFRLMIVDSIIALLRVDFTGRGELAERQQKLTQMPSRLTKIAEESNVVVYMTNQVIADPGGDMFMSDPKKHAGGHVLAHAATIRLMFRKGEVTEGINADDLRKLQEAGIYTCNRFMMQTKKQLTGIKGLSEAKADNICEAAEKLLNFGYVTGSDVLLKIQSVIQVTTGGQALDELPGGGTEISCIIEAFEKFRSGKTQFAHTAMMLSLSKSNQHKMSDMVKPDYTTLVDALTQRKKATVHYLLLKPSNDSVAVVYGTLEGVPLIYGRIDIADWVGYRIVSSDNNHWCLMINDELHLRFVNVQTRAVVEVELLPFQPNAPPKFVGGCFYGDPEFSPIIAVFLNGSVGLTGRRANSIMYYDGKVWLEMNLDEDFLMTAPFMMNQALYWISNRCVLQKVDMSFLQSSLFVQELLGTDFPTWILHEGLLYVVALNGNGKAIVVKVNQTFDGYEIVPLSFSVYAICDGVGYAEEEQPSSIFLPAYHGCHIAVVDSIGVVSEYFTHPGCTCLPAWIGSILSFE